MEHEIPSSKLKVLSSEHEVPSSEHDIPSSEHEVPRSEHDIPYFESVSVAYRRYRFSFTDKTTLFVDK
jgi:hypothetical protein